MDSKLYALYSILVPVSDEYIGNKLIFEIEQNITTHLGNKANEGLTAAALPKIADLDRFIKDYQKLVFSQTN